MIDRLLSQEWVGLLWAAVVLASVITVWALGRRVDRTWMRRSIKVVGAVTALLALAMGVGSLVHVRRVIQDDARYPMPGKLYDVGGHKMHIMADGERRLTPDGRSPAVLWLPGAGGQGLGLSHLHKQMAKETRSILYDRSGVGWSEIGPYPRSVGREVKELKALLDAAGESEPFVIASYSVGGLLAAKYAYTYPDDVAGLVLFEPLPPGREGDILVPILEGLGTASRLVGWGTMFGVLSPDAMKKNKKSLPGPENMDAVMARGAGRVGASRSSSDFFFQLAGDREDLVREPGSLGDIPVLVVEREGQFDPERVMENMGPDLAAILSWGSGKSLGKDETMSLETLQGIMAESLGKDSWQRFVEFCQESKDLYRDLSSKGKLVHSPDGATHSIPYEKPEWALDRIREMVATVTS